MYVQCPRHPDIFKVANREPVLCVVGGESLGRLPSTIKHTLSPELPRDFWEFCCDCKLFRPVNIESEIFEKCACGLTPSWRFWCDCCHTTSFDTDERSGRDLMISVQGYPFSGCPVCSRMVALSGLHQHKCDSRRIAFTSGFDRCPYCKDPIGPFPSFPVLAARFLNRVRNTDKLVVGYDVLEIEKSVLIAAPEGEFIVIRNGTNNAETILLPKRTHFSSSHDYAIYAGLYDCTKPAAGEVRILSPAVVEEVDVGWRARERGRLELVTLDQTSETSDAKPLTWRSVDDFLPNANDATTRTSESRHDRAIEKSKVNIVSDDGRFTFSNEEGEAFDFDQEKDSHEDVPSTRAVEWRLRLIVGIVASLILLLAALAAMRSRSDQTNVDRNPSPTPSSSPTMVRVNGGEFRMGNSAGDAYERPAHVINVTPFLIDAFEVTCEEYLKFIKAQNHRAPSNWIDGKYPNGDAKKPVTGVDWDDATAYASWAGKRLPTEEEWEFAARGADGRRYPWGNDWQRGAANADGASKGLADVGTFKSGAPLLKTYDMIGNAWEWTASQLVAYPGGHLPPQPAGDLKVIRGGSWQSDRASATTTYRWGWPARGGKDYSNTGFRCVKDLPPETKE